MSKIAICISGKWEGSSNKLLLGHEVSDTIGPETDVAIVGTHPIEFDDVKHLRGIVRLGVGYDNLPIAECREAGIVLAYTPNAPSMYVAEHALALMMSALRFRDRNRPGKALEEISVAIIGRGRIGKRFASILTALGIPLVVVDPVADTTFDEIHKIYRTDLDTALAMVDVVSLHIPLAAKTCNLINERTLWLMKQDAVLINTSRGGVVNERHLLEHLEKNENFRAALDVLKDEPYNGPLKFLKNCITTPHVSSMTIPARKAMELHAIKAALAICLDVEPEWPIPEREVWETR